MRELYRQRDDERDLRLDGGVEQPRRILAGRLSMAMNAISIARTAEQLEPRRSPSKIELAADPEGPARPRSGSST